MLNKILRGFVVVIICLGVLVGGIVLWWFYGSGLSEETAYKLANDYAQEYAARNQLDLTSYVPPTVGTQAGRRIFEFVWTPKQGGTTFRIVVDPMSVEVYHIE
jgi:hypothetical protein